MRIFVLEDNQERIKFFQRMLIGSSYTIVAEYDKAIEAINKETYDTLYLDHDLGLQELVNPDEEKTGYQFVKYLVENNLQKDAIIVIHSHNPVGARVMLDTLTHKGYKASIIPFTNIYHEIESKNK